VIDSLHRNGTLLNRMLRPQPTYLAQPSAAPAHLHAPTSVGSGAPPQTFRGGAPASHVHPATYGVPHPHGYATHAAPAPAPGHGPFSGAAPTRRSGAPAAHDHGVGSASRGFWGQLMSPTPTHLARRGGPPGSRVQPPPQASGVPAFVPGTPAPLYATRGGPPVSGTRPAAGPSTTSTVVVAGTASPLAPLPTRGSPGRHQPYSPPAPAIGTRAGGYYRHRAGEDTAASTSVEDGGSALSDQATTETNPVPITYNPDSDSAPVGGDTGGMPGEGGTGVYIGGGGEDGRMPGEGGTGLSPYPYYPSGSDVPPTNMDMVDDEMVKSDLMNGLRDLYGFGRGVIRRLVSFGYHPFDKLFTSIQNSWFGLFILFWPLLVTSFYSQDPASMQVAASYQRAAKPPWALAPGLFGLAMFITNVALGMQGFKILKGLAPEDQPYYHRKGVVALILYVLLPLTSIFWTNAFVNNNYAFAFYYTLAYTYFMYVLYKKFKELDESTETSMKVVFWWNVYLLVLSFVMWTQNDRISGA
jgi:hypothetical protein